MKAYARIAALLSAATMLLAAAGCGSEDSSSSQAASSAAAEESSAAAAESSAAESQEETSTPEESSETESKSENGNKSGTVDAGMAMKVSNTDGTISISRAEKKSTPMGEEGTWTIFIYLCGTDLESGQGSATSDIDQMLAAAGSDKVRFVFQTGGTSEWQKEELSSEEAQRFVVQNQEMELVDSAELGNMGDPDNFAGFLKWGVENYPAEKMGVVFWDHGGGSISGACFDELNDSNGLTLAEINKAFSEVYEGMTDQFEFIGFDCCLMGTAETANILATYARYFYGSQECEPGSGWDYTTYGTYLAENPTCSGADLGKVIADSFYEECAQGGEENTCTLSIVDLSKIDDFVTAFNDYSKALYEGASNGLAGVVRGITSADNFGGNNKSEGYTNMVDLGGIFDNCSSIADSTAVKQALEDCVVYNKNGSNHSKAAGLSVYYPLKVQSDDELKTFAGVALNPYYLSLVDRIVRGDTGEEYSNDKLFKDGEWISENCDTNTDDEYLQTENAGEAEESKLITFASAPSVSDEGKFSFTLDEKGMENAASVSALIYYADEGKNISLGETSDVSAEWETGTFVDNFDGYWLALENGKPIATFIAETTEEYTVYTSPIKLNDKRTNLRIRVDNDYTVTVEGAWDGISENGSASREITKLKSGDKIVPLYFLDDGSEFEGTEYEWTGEDDCSYGYLPEGVYFYGFSIDDVYGNFLTTDPVVFSITKDGNITFKGAQQEEGQEEEKQEEEQEEAEEEE